MSTLSIAFSLARLEILFKIKIDKWNKDLIYKKRAQQVQFVNVK